MHRLLHRQLRKHLSVEDEVPEPLKAFIAAVGDAYEDFDSERALLERSTELSSKELSEATDKARRAAEELRKSQALFKTVLDNMPAVMFVRDLDERYQLINRTYEDVYGVSRDTVQGQTLKDVFPKAEADEYGAHDQEAIDKGEPIVKEIRIEHGGEERIYSSIKFPIFDASGAPSAVGGIETDVTEEKRAQEVLHESESRLRAIFEAAPVAVTIVRQDGTFQFANTCMAEMVGVPRDQLIGQSARDFYADPKEREVIRKRLGEEGSLYDLEVQMKRADGSAFWGLLSLVRTEEEGEPSYYGWMYDITERKKAESRFSALLESAPDATVIVDRSGEIALINQQTERLFGYSAQEVIGQKVEALIPERYRKHHPQHRNGFFENTGVRPMGVGLELYGQAKDGREFPIEISLSPIETDEGTLVAASVRDVTERKQIEAEAEARSKLIELLGRTAAHANRANSVEEALRDSLADVCDYTGWPVGHVYVPATDGSQRLVSSKIWHIADSDRFAAFRDITEKTSFAPGEGLPGRVWSSNEPEWVVDVSKAANFPRAKYVDGMGVRAAFATPVLVGSELVAVLEFYADAAFEPDEALLQTLEQIGSQLAQVVERERAAAELRESEARFRDLLESSPVGVTIARASDGRLQYVNPRFVEMFRSDEESVIGSGGANYFADPAVREEIIERFQRDGFVRDYLAEMKRTDGSLFWALLTFLPTEYQGEPARLGWLYDIDDRKRAEEAARKREGQLRTVLDNIPAGLYLTNAELELEVFNEQFSELYGFPKDMVKEGTTLPDLIRWLASQGNYGEVDVEALVEERSKSLKSGKLTTSEQHPPSGLTVQLTHAPAQDGGVCGVVTDITERKKAEEAARKRESQLRTVLDNIPAGLYLTNADLELEVFNEQFSQLFGFSEGMAKEGAKISELTRWLASQGMYGEVDINRLVEERMNAFSSGKTNTFELIPPSGLAVQHTHGPAQDGGICGVVTDITERKKGEEELRQAKDGAENALADLKAAQVQLVQSEKMASLGQLTAGIAHEIKNPLNFVNNFAETSVELLEDLKDIAGPAMEHLDKDDRDEAEDLIETLLKDMGTIAHHGQRADSIVKNMLLHSRGQGSERLPTDLNALVEEGMNLAYHGERARDRAFQVELEPDFDANVGKMTVVPQDIMRVLVNLVGNAFYATKKRREQSGNGYKPVVRVSTRAVADGVELRVRDNGTGMPEEVRKKLFTPFFTTKPTGEGTGLGLSISYDIVVQNHGGRMDVDSREGEFTEFVIRLPRAAATDRGGKA